MPDVATCLGREADGASCICRRYIPKTNQKDDEPLFCRNCGHFDSSHPDNSNTIHSLPESKYSISNIVSTLKEGVAASRSKFKTTEEQARTETNAGLKRANEVDATTSKKKAMPQGRSRGKGKPTVPRKRPKDVKRVGAVIMLPCGLNNKGNLAKSKSPDPQQIQLYADGGLAFLSETTEEDEDDENILTFSILWNSENIDDWLREIFPDLFEHMDQTHPLNGKSPKYHWVAVRKVQKQVKVFEKQGEINGANLESLMTGTSKSWTVKKLFFATRHEIPKSVYEKLKEQSDGEDIVSDEPEDSDDHASDNKPTSKSIKVEESLPTSLRKKDTKKQDDDDGAKPEVQDQRPRASDDEDDVPSNVDVKGKKKAIDTSRKRKGGQDKQYDTPSSKTTTIVEIEDSPCTETRSQKAPRVSIGKGNANAFVQKGIGHRLRSSFHRY
ncbi:hypothetical protein SCHPADRAFT_215895 [Schizopora paradoxa]|uniref:Uncharacterized protein n=1 Tax=Schizopora paradoxa TaxID=27342 RepID=A0A0H2RWU3_9AGAM|nr:hypothetical protein SCHPADRAFT_215895 [Schizopora paradoxa]